MAAEKECSHGPPLFSTILPRRIEDAGLEYTELAADSIERAFEIAASKVKSAATSIMGVPTLDAELCEDDDGDGELGHLAPGEGMEDACIDLGSADEAKHGSCLECKTGGLIEDGKDKIVIGKEGASVWSGGEGVVDLEDLSSKLGGKSCVGDGKGGGLGSEGVT